MLKDMVKFLGQFDQNIYLTELYGSASMESKSMEDLLGFNSELWELRENMEIYRRAEKLLSPTNNERLDDIATFLDNYADSNSFLFSSALRAKKQQIKTIPKNSVEYKRLEQEIENLRNVT